MDTIKLKFSKPDEKEPLDDYVVRVKEAVKAALDKVTIPKNYRYFDLYLMSNWTNEKEQRQHHQNTLFADLNPKNDVLNGVAGILKDVMRPNNEFKPVEINFILLINVVDGKN